MAKPTKESTRAVQILSEHHEGDAATFYASKDGESAVIVINDPDLLEVIMVLMNFTMEKLEDLDDPRAYSSVLFSHLEAGEA
jgi:hypothetical protein